MNINNYLLNNFPPMQRTEVICDCGFADMQIIGNDKENYAKYQCPQCKSKIDFNPKSVALRNKIDRKLHRLKGLEK
jgi:hypothetical protein